MNLLRSNNAVLPWFQAIGTALVVLGIVLGNFPIWYWMASLGAYFLVGCLGITMTFHRYLTHRSFRMSRWTEILFTIFGALAGTGSSIGWNSVHMTHHVHADQVGDPHSPVIDGVKILFASYPVEFDKWAVRRLLTDPFHQFVHNYYHGILLLWLGLLLAVSWQLAFFAFVVPATIMLWVSVTTSYFTHTHGYRLFDTKDNSRNNWIFALISFGEGWHNNHHKYPGRWNLTINWWEFDVTAWMIRVFRSG